MLCLRVFTLCFLLPTFVADRNQFLRQADTTYETGYTTQQRSELEETSAELKQELATFEEGAGQHASAPDRAQAASLEQEIAMIQNTLKASKGAAPDQDATSFVAKSRVQKGDDAITIRPNAQNNVADVVEFGMFAKNFFGVSMKDHTFTMDNVLTLKWNDPRTESLIPDGSDDITLSAKAAAKSIWMPEVVITNREIRKFELVSTSVFVSRGGNVTKVERSLCMMKNKFKVEAFPYDKQFLATKVASSKYMLDELKLQPITASSVSGTNDGLFDGMGFTELSFETTEFEDIDGALQKSRGVFTVHVKRDIDKYFQNHFIPAFLFLFISYGVFWFPYVNPFITPRLALGILALLQFTILALKVDKMLPSGGPFSWNDLFNQNCQWMMFFTVVLNIFIEIIYHSMGVQKLGKSLNHEAKLLWPFMLMVSMIIAFADTSGKNLKVQSIISTVVLIVTWTAFVLISMQRVKMQQMDDAKNTADGK